MFVMAPPSVSYDEETWTVFDSPHAGNFIGIYVGEYTLAGQFIQAVIDQQMQGAGNHGRLQQRRQCQRAATEHD